MALPQPKFTHADRNALPPALAARVAQGLPVVEFSFSGLKTAVARLLERRGVAIAPGLDVPTDAGPLGRQEVADFCASFQRVVVETLIDRTFEAARQLGAKSIGIAGGVSANSRLRRDAAARGEREGTAGLHSGAVVVHGQCRHDCGGGPAQARARRNVAARFHRARDHRHLKTMKVHTDYLWFETKQRQEFVRITDDVAAIVKKSGVREGMALVSAMHITAAVYVNDWEDGLISDFKVWLEKLAPAGLPYRHHQTGEDNADAHLKRTLMGHQIIVPITAGKLDLGPWEQVFYAEFDGQRRKRVVVKVMGE